MDEDGTIHVSLPLGKYKLKETKTPYGYVYPDTKEWSLEFKWQDGKDEYVLNSTDATDDKGLLHIKNDFAGTKLELIQRQRNPLKEHSLACIPSMIFTITPEKRL